MGMRNYSIRDRHASIGMGAMIVFIALVLVSGIAASVIISTSTTLETQSMKTGRDTTAEVSTGLSVCAIEGYAAPGSDISKLAILVRPRAGTGFVDIGQCFVELCNETVKVVLNYTTAYYLKPDGRDDIFSAATFPDHGNAYDSTRFGILVLEDADNSVSSTNPIINRGDKAYLCFNSTGIFSDIPERSEIWGMVVPEEGAPGMIDFITPGTYAASVMELYWDM